MPAIQAISVDTRVVQFGKTWQECIEAAAWLSLDPSLCRRQVPSPHCVCHHAARQGYPTISVLFPRQEAVVYHRRCKMRRQWDECGIITIILLWTEEIVLRGEYFSKCVLSLQEDRKEAISACQDKPRPSISYCPSRSRWTLLFFHIIQTQLNSRHGSLSSGRSTHHPSRVTPLLAPAEPADSPPNPQTKA